MLPVVDSFKERFNLDELIVAADVGLLSKENIKQLQEGNYQYILGARIKNEPLKLQQQIMENKPEEGQSICLGKDENTRLIVSYTSTGAEREHLIGQEDWKNFTSG